MKVMITEADTFLGQLVCKHLSSKKGLEVIPHSGQSFPSIEDKLDACVFLFNPEGSHSEIIARNHHIPKQLLRKLHEVKCGRFITVSPIDVYGLKKTCNDDSNAALQPKTALGDACYNLEKVVKDCRELWGTSYSCLRLANLFGTEEKELPPERQSFVYQALQKLKNDQPIEANNRAVPWVDTCAFLTTLQRCLTNGHNGTLNVCCSPSKSQVEIVGVLAYFMGKNKTNIVSVPTQEFDQLMTTELLEGHFRFSYDVELSLRTFVDQEGCLRR